MLERKIQDSIISHYEREGWLVVKIIGCTLNGWPDLQAHRDGVTKFLEAKAPGKKPTPLQLYRHQQLRKAGFEVLVIDYIMK